MNNDSLFLRLENIFEYGCYIVREKKKNYPDHTACAAFKHLPRYNNVDILCYLHIMIFRTFIERQNRTNSMKT